jgi:ubiquinone biosynthesis protein COQ9
MSKMMYVNAPAPESAEVISKSLTTHYNTLMITIVIIASSLLIGIGFAYMASESGHYSQAYGLCKDDILSNVRTGEYDSVDETMAALKSCDGAAS